MQKKISAQSIETIKGASITQVVGHYLSLKAAGSNKTACCPFHAEKSPSFIVSEAKEIYKCFGCGASGDAIKFVREIDKLDFIPAIEKIAEICGIQLQYDEWEQSEKEKEAISAADAQEQVLNFVVPLYSKQLYDLENSHPVKQYLHGRGITDDIIIEWQLGWAGTDWNFITPQMISKGWYAAAEKLGVVRRSKHSENSFDGYRSRITIPILDRAGKYIGMGGRFILIDDADQGKEYPKYINPSECELYNKRAVLFGLNRSAKAIQDKKAALVMEGYLDVITSFHKGHDNVVGTSGTAFTKDQIQLLKKYCNKVVAMFDNDAAGKTAFNKSLPDLLNAGLQVDHVAYEEKDPDLQLQKHESLGTISDGLMYRVRELMEAAADDLIKKAEAKQVILELLVNVKNEFYRGNYFDTICTKYKWNKKETKQQYETMADQIMGDLDDDDAVSISALPDYLSQAQKDHVHQYGYVAVHRKEKGKPMVGYYSYKQNSNGDGGKPTTQKIELTNFVVQPLFHVYAGIESRYLLQIDNGYRKAVLDVPSKSIPTIDQFQAITVSEGNFLIFGGKPQWLRIASDLLQSFPRCMEIKNLGWQVPGFWAFVDKIFIPGKGYQDLDNWGIFKHQDNNYLIPASCEAYRQLQHTGDDPYENDRHLAHKKTTVTFSRWAKQMQLVYLDKGIVGVAGVIMAMFRDLVFEVDNNCPHLYAFGEPSSGKSKWAESLAAVFFFRRPAFNLNSGTDFAFFSYMQRYRNAPAHLNEFEIEVIKPEWFQAIKGVFDGEGRERGKGGSKNRTEIMKVHSLLVLTGQKLVTADDNSIVTRSLIEPFSVREDLTEAEKLAYTELKEWEAKGLSGMLSELMELRPVMQDKYKDHFNNLLSYWRKEHPESRNSNQRILQNYAHLATGYTLASNHIELPMSAKEFTAQCLQKAIKWSSFIRSSDTLSEFWRTLEFLADSHQVVEGWDYIIEETTAVKIRRSKEEETMLNFNEPAKVLYLRINNVHKLFQSEFRKRSGKEAMNESNLLHYMQSRKYFLGPVKQKRFKRYVWDSEEKSSGGQFPSTTIQTSKKAQEQIASCYAFLYSDLGIEIERFAGVENQQVAVEEQDELPFP